MLVVELLDVWSSRRKYEDDSDSFDESLGGDDQGELDVCTAQLPTISFLSVMNFDDFLLWNLSMLFCN